MLLNLSNHPSKFWSEKQINAAKPYGEIVDMKFPMINPHHELKDIEKLSEQYLSEIIKLKPDAVHLMGEMVFTFNLALKCQKKGIKTFASTSERITEQVGNEKKATFNFILFRNYF